MPDQVQYCTHPGERVFDPVDVGPLPEPDTCDHDECRPPPGTLIVVLDAEPASST